MPRRCRLVPVRHSARLLVGVCVLSLAACSAAPPEAADAGAPDAPAAVTPGPGEPSLEEVRRATERFRDVNVALAEGYVRDPFDVCDTAEMMGRPGELGAMGIHYVRMDLLGITAPPNPKVGGTGIHTDFRTPSILIYEPQADGSLDLVAVENLAFASAWEAAGHTSPPTFHGVPYDYMADDPATPAEESHMFEPHWDRHVWLYRENPAGTFAPFNPRVTCEHHTGAAHWHE